MIGFPVPCLDRITV